MKAFYRKYFAGFPVFNVTNALKISHKQFAFHQTATYSWFYNFILMDGILMLFKCLLTWKGICVEFTTTIYLYIKYFRLYKFPSFRELVLVYNMYSTTTSQFANSSSTFLFHKCLEQIFLLFPFLYQITMHYLLILSLSIAFPYL